MEVDQLAAEGADGLAVLLHVGDDEDLLDAALALLAHVLHGLAEVRREPHLVLVADALIAEDEDAVLEQGGAYLSHLGGGQLAAQVEAADLGAESAAGGQDAQVRAGGEGHAVLPESQTSQVAKVVRRDSAGSPLGEYSWPT